MRLLTPSGSAMTLQPATVISPLSGTRIPANMRNMVVLPAPSGPTRLKISPGRTEKLRSRTATTSPKLRLSPRTSIALELDSIARNLSISFAQIDGGVGGHSRLEFAIGIVEVDLDPVDEGDAFLMGLDALGSEFRAIGDEGDASVIFLIGISVDGNIR